MNLIEDRGGRFRNPMPVGRHRAPRKPVNRWLGPIAILTGAVALLTAIVGAMTL